MLNTACALRIAILVTAATLVAGCDQEAADPGSGPDANTSQLRFGNGKSHVPGFGLAQAYVPADQPVAMSTYTLCTVDGPVSITDIELKEAENLTLVDWGVRDYPPVGEDLGVWNGEVLGDATFSQAPVPGSCHSPKHLSELDISAQMSQEGIGIAHVADLYSHLLRAEEHQVANNASALVPAKRVTAHTLHTQGGERQEEAASAMNGNGL